MEKRGFIMIGSIFPGCYCFCRHFRRGGVWRHAGDGRWAAGGGADGAFREASGPESGCVPACIWTCGGAIPRPVGRQGPGVPRMPDNPLVRASGTTFSTEASGLWGDGCPAGNTHSAVLPATFVIPGPRLAAGTRFRATNSYIHSSQGTGRNCSLRRCCVGQEDRS